MRQPISQNKITIVENDGYKQKLFKEAYEINAKIRTTNINDLNFNWVQVVLNFKDTLGKNYGLVEFYKEDDDNSTDHVDFEYEGHDGKWIFETYKTFIEAELAMVALMKKRAEGLNGNA